MALPPSVLGASLDDLVAGNPAISVWESAEAVTISGLDEKSVKAVASLLEPVDWSSKIEDDAGEITSHYEARDSFGPFLITIDKPLVEGITRYLTISGFERALEKGSNSKLIQVARCEVGFSTGLFSVAPWGAGDIFIESAETKSPVSLVRDTSGKSLVPPDARALILRSSVTDPLWRDPVFQTFVSFFAPRLAWSIATEVSAGGTAHFHGPPRAILDVRSLQKGCSLVAFRNLQRIVSWVYEDPRASEQRHTLASIEVARSARSDINANDLFRISGLDIFESARLGYQLSLSDLSREAIKAQGELRKAISEDMNKAADAVRSMTGSIAIAVASGVGLVGARATTSTPEWIIALIGSAVALHLIAVAISGWMALQSQSSLRRQWRQRFYRFVSDDDYKAMIETPMLGVEHQFNLVGALAVIVGSVILIASLHSFNIFAI